MPAMNTLSKVAFALAFGLTTSAHALTVEEDFDYTPGFSLNGQNGGVGWGGAWNGNNSVVIGAPNLDFPGYTEISNKAVMNNNGTTYTISRNLLSAINYTNSTSASMSFLFNLTGDDADTGIRFSGLSLFSGGAGGTEMIFFGKPGNTTDVGFEKYAGGPLTDGVSVDFTTSTVFLFQAEFTLAQSESTVTVTLSDNNGPGGSAQVLAIWSNLSLGANFSFDNIRLIRDFALDSGITAQYDTLQISTVPEPSTALLLVGGGLGLAAARRRARR